MTDASRIAEQERNEAIRLLADALEFSRSLHRVPRPGMLTFLVEELITQRDALIEQRVAECGGKPEQGADGGRWYLHWQFHSNVWREHESHKLNMHVVLKDKDEVSHFVAELRDWIAFIEESLLDHEQQNKKGELT